MRLGRVFLNARYYNPTTGTFLSVDPLNETTGEPYLYANGNPTTLSDPTGLEPSGYCAGYSDAARCYDSVTLAYNNAFVHQQSALGSERKQWQKQAERLGAQETVIQKALYGPGKGLGEAFVEVVVLTAIVTAVIVVGPELWAACSAGAALCATAVQRIGALAAPAAIDYANGGGTGPTPESAMAAATTELDDALLNQARQARDDLATKLGSSKATVTAGYDPLSGRIAAGCNANPIGCAEDDVARQLGIPKDTVRYTEAVRPRNMEEVPICTYCQATTSPSQYPPNVQAQPGGRWVR